MHQYFVVDGGLMTFLSRARIDTLLVIGCRQVELLHVVEDGLDDLEVLLFGGTVVRPGQILQLGYEAWRV